MDTTAKQILIWGGLGLALYYFLSKKQASNSIPPFGSPGAPGTYNGIPGSDPDSGL